MRVLLALVVTVAGGHLRPPHHLSDRALAWHVSRVVFKTHAKMAFCIAGFETGHTYNPRAVSPTDDDGEWQIHQGLEKYGRRIYNIWFNAKVAFRMSKGGTDWSPWTTQHDC